MATIDIRVKLNIPSGLNTSDDVGIVASPIYTDENGEAVLELTAVPSSTSDAD